MELYYEKKKLYKQSYTHFRFNSWHSNILPLHRDHGDRRKTQCEYQNGPIYNMR